MIPKISIIVPVYQVEQYIENCMISVCNQTFKDFEIVLVNDGTIDKSIVIAEKILLYNKMTYIIINQDNLGQSNARNTGINNSNGEWIVCIDSDDVLYYDFLKILYKSCEESDINVSIGNFQYVNDNVLFKRPNVIYDSEFITKEEILQNFLTRKIKIIIPAILIKKEFILKNNLLYDEKIKFSEDQHYIWRVLFSDNKFAFNRTQIYNYFLRPNSIMTSSNIEKIMTGYNGFIELTENIKNRYECIFSEKIMARWVLGVLHSSAKILSYKEHKKLAEKMNYKLYTNKLFRFSHAKIRIILLILRVNYRAFYLICKKI